jgi:hypothetical protein
MLDEMHHDIKLEELLHEKFGLNTSIDKVILRQVPAGGSVKATVFLSKNKHLYAYIEARSKMQLADVKRIIFNMGLKAELYFPPAGKTNYFEEVARAKFLEVFPGRNVVTSEDLIFYRTLADYNPALVQIAEVRDGVIKVYDSDAKGKWRVGTKFSYRRIKTS